MANGLASGAVLVSADDVILAGDLTLPRDAQGIVLFAHGSGSSRLSRRNRHVAGMLNDVGLATLLFDLLTSEEEQIDSVTRQLRFDMELLARRLVGAIDWVHGQDGIAHLPIGCFGASTGGGAALMAAARRPDLIHAVVSRGGRPDLAMQDLPDVRAPTLLIVGGSDTQVITLNRQAMARMTTEVELELVPGATHLFEEPGSLDTVAELARTWFVEHLAPTSSPRSGS